MSGESLVDTVVLTIVLVACVALIVRYFARKVSTKGGGACRDCSQNSTCGGGTETSATSMRAETTNVDR